MKKNRHDAILALIEKEDIATQEELMLKLNEMGYKVTQATVSRDIKSLKLVKSPVADGQYKYSYVKNDNIDFSSKYFSILSHSVVHVDYAINTVVIKCYAGMAQAACAAVDSMAAEKIVGTLAGDDTIFVLCRTEQAAAEFSAWIKKFLAAAE
ncbi:MAG: arginine repressor [Faecalibacterium sp.]|nr:arginine repressor [Ruminococcus sp.]MCM1392719.1 arginine repressor [Ruminococcus sp.]MCM1485189.1 arginine repressor [Faecalibacterium sp.]